MVGGGSTDETKDHVSSVNCNFIIDVHIKSEFIIK